MQGHCYSFGNLKLSRCPVPEVLSSIHYHGVIPHWKGIHTVKMSLRCLAFALLLATISVPATLMAAAGRGPDGNRNGPPPIVRPTLPPDGNPWPHVLADGNRNGPPPIVRPSLPPDGNPWPHMTVADGNPSGAPPIVHRPALPPDGNPWPHMTVADGSRWLRTAATDSAV